MQSPVPRDQGEKRQMDNQKPDVRLSASRVPRASEEIYEQLREKIISGEFKPGDSLPSERSMMESLHRSRPTIREALRMLERAGLVRTAQGKGGAIVLEPGTNVIIRPLEDMISLTHISNSELLEFRELVETAFVGWAAERRSDEDVTRLREIVEETRAAIGTPAFFESDIRFHKVLAKAAGNSLGQTITEALHQLVTQVLQTNFYRQSPERQQEMSLEVVQNHEDIVAAVAARDAKAAKAQMRKHNQGFESLIQWPEVSGPTDDKN